MASEINGTSGNDTLTADADHTMVHGNSGDDQLKTGTYNHTQLHGGVGNDTYVINWDLSDFSQYFSAILHEPDNGGSDTLDLTAVVESLNYIWFTYSGNALTIDTYDQNYRLTGLVKIEDFLTNNTEYKIEKLIVGHQTFDLTVSKDPQTLNSILEDIEVDYQSVISGNFTGTITESTDSAIADSVSGKLNITDPYPSDGPFFNDVTNTDSTYGSFALSKGIWTYTLDKDKIRFLAAGQEREDNFIFVASDGSKQTITVTIVGAIGKEPSKEGTNSSDNFKGGNGDDVFFAAGGDDFLSGGDGNDTLSGGEGNDQIFAGIGDQGNDQIQGHIGDDIVAGGAGNDILAGGVIGRYLDTEDSVFHYPRFGGNDTIFGGDGDDTIAGGVLDIATGMPIYGEYAVFNSVEGKNVIYSGTGADIVFGDNLADLIGGGAGGDNIKAADGDDIIYGGKGVPDDNADTIDGGNGNDIVYAGNDSDIILGGQGDDTLFGGTGDDTINGGVGNDIIYGGSGNDVLDGSNGKDFFGFSIGFGKDTIIGFETEDKIDLSEFANLSRDNILKSTQTSLTGITILVSEENTITLSEISQATFKEIVDSGSILFG